MLANQATQGFETIYKGAKDALVECALLSGNVFPFPDKDAYQDIMALAGTIRNDTDLHFLSYSKRHLVLWGMVDAYIQKEAPALTCVHLMRLAWLTTIENALDGGEWYFGQWENANSLIDILAKTGVDEEWAYENPKHIADLSTLTKLCSLYRN